MFDKISPLELMQFLIVTPRDLKRILKMLLNT